MEVRQRMELTGTNNSIGLNHSHCLCSSQLSLRMSAAKAAILRTARAKMRDGRLALRASPVSGTKNQLLDYMRFADLVVMAGRLHPFPFRTRP